MGLIVISVPMVMALVLKFLMLGKPRREDSREDKILFYLLSVLLEGTAVFASVVVFYFVSLTVGNFLPQQATERTFRIETFSQRIENRRLVYPSVIGRVIVSNDMTVPTLVYDLSLSQEGQSIQWSVDASRSTIINDGQPAMTITVREWHFTMPFLEYFFSHRGTDYVFNIPQRT